MTLHYPVCDDVAELVDNNGITKSPATRIEFYECVACGHEFRKVLTA